MIATLTYFREPKCRKLSTVHYWPDPEPTHGLKSEPEKKKTKTPNHRKRGKGRMFWEQK